MKELGLDNKLCDIKEMLTGLEHMVREKATHGDGGTCSGCRIINLCHHPDSGAEQVLELMTFLENMAYTATLVMATADSPTTVLRGVIIDLLVVGIDIGKAHVENQLINKMIEKVDVGGGGEGGEGNGGGGQK